MKLSFIFELLLIFILIAFAASAVLDSSSLRNNKKTATIRKHEKIPHKKRQDLSANKYCSCSLKLCNCCREFNIPVVSLQGPGCASLQYLKGDKLAISMSFGERVLTNTTISSKKPQPVCMPLPGGVSKFCGRVYNIGRKGDDFNACLGLELRALKKVEAALRVSCFRFGSNGLRVEAPQPLPVVEEEENDDEDDEDDEDDDDDDDDDDTFSFDDDDEDTDNDVDSVDYGTFSVFDDDFIGEYFQSDSSDNRKRPAKKTTPAPLKKVTQKAVIKPLRRKVIQTTKAPAKITGTTSIKLSTNSPLQIVRKPGYTNKIMNNMAEKQPSGEQDPSSQHESIAALTAMLQVPSAETSQVVATDVKPAEVASIPIPDVRVTHTLDKPASIETTQAMSETSANIVNEQSVVSMSPGTTVQAESVTSSEPKRETTIFDKIETTTFMQSDEEFSSETSVPNFIIKNNEESEDEDDDPISEVVEEVLEDEDNAESIKNETKFVNDKDIVNMNNKNHTKQEGKDVIDDIVDGMVDTFTGDDDSDESRKPEEDDEEDDDLESEDDEDDDDDDDDILGRNAHRRQIQRRFKGRQSRDMWLARLHW